MYIECKGLSKRYFASPIEYLKLGRQEGSCADFWALKDISFRIEEGERVGIIGRNGAGKSTLLNILSGYSHATEGELAVTGKVTPVMEIGSSINQEETGRENIRTAGRLSGIQENQLAERVQEVIDFVDLGEYIDQPMKIYSSGMIAKVSFACVLFTMPEILVIDEVLGVGDAAFKAKSEAKTRELCEKGKILLMVSHSMATIRKYTDRCIWLDKGRIRMDGSSAKVTEAFELSVKKEQESQLVTQMEKAIENSIFCEKVRIKQLQVLQEDGTFGAEIHIHQAIRVKAEIQSEASLGQVDLQISCYSLRGYLLFASSYHKSTGQWLVLEPGRTAMLETRIEDCNFNTGTYQISLMICQKDTPFAKRAALFRVVNDQYYNYLDCPQVYYHNHAKLKKLHREENV